MSRASQDTTPEGLRATLRSQLALGLLPLPAVVPAYVALVVDCAWTEWLAFTGILATTTVVSMGVALSLLCRRQGPLGVFFGERIGAEQRAAPSSIAAGADFAAVVSLPACLSRATSFASVASLSLVPVGLAMAGFPDWLVAARLLDLLIAGLSTALFAAALVYYRARETFAPLRAERAGAMGTSPGDRADFVRARSLGPRLVVAVTVPAMLSILLVVHLAYEALRSSAEDEALTWAVSAVEAVAETDPLQPLESRMSAALPQRRFWPTSLSMVEVRPGRVAARGFSDGFVESVERASASGASAGLVAPAQGQDIGAWQRQEDGAILIASLGRGALPSPFEGLNLPIAGLVLVLLGITLLLGRLVSRDLLLGIRLSRERIDRMLAGELRPGAGWESGDELGELGRDVESMGMMMHETVERMAAAAGRFDQKTASLADLVMEVAGHSGGQLSALRGATELMDAINDQLTGASRTAVELGAAIEESSGSVLELGATGEELNDTASVLTSRVDAVSDSLAQIVRSVKQVGATTERLSAASEETSSSMEEMASAMRAVDNSAETMANLSSDVVDKAETGQAKVVQTIAGMDAIREATDAAERVIRGLGARTSEIGGILDVIDDVADETNLLALNAAIIAAQAGDQGKAFSVVADEIKELADRVLASTKEIGGLIRAVQDESENAIGAIEAGSESVMSGVDLSAEAGRTLEQITEASRESGTRIGEIVNSVREQTKAASHVVALMERVRDSADEIGAAGIEQDRGNDVVHRSVLTMREVAQQVRRTTEDQARGFRQIRENVEGVRTTVEGIKRSLHDQSGSCGDVIGKLAEAYEQTRANEGVATRMREQVRELAGEAATMREDIERLRVG